MKKEKIRKTERPPLLECYPAGGQCDFFLGSAVISVLVWVEVKKMKMKNRKKLEN